MIEGSFELLNEQQRKAVLHSGSPLLILAGAGSGKTRVITFKIAWFIEKLGVDPRSILAVTFTNKAAGEMRERAESLSPEAKQVVIRTFHSFGAWLLRRNIKALGLADNFTIYDNEDSLSLLARLYPDRPKQHINYWNYLISRAKDNCIAPNGEVELISNDPELREVYANYEEYLRDIGNVDFGDLILRPIELLKNDPAVAKRIRDRFSIILVDEYQDSNFAQYSLLRELYQPGSYICVVGDDDQSIYRFRGAEVRNILDFSQQFQGADIIKLEQNYRSTNPILKLAGDVVRHNEGRLGKELWTNREGGKKPVVARLSDEAEEVDYVLNIIRSNSSGNTAILYRTNAQSRNFETSFLRENIPYKIIGTTRFYAREEVKDAVAILKLLANPKDVVAFARIVNKPARGIGKLTLARILDHAAAGNLVQAAKHTITGATAKIAAGLRSFVAFMGTAEKLLKTPGKHSNLGELLEVLLEMSGLIRHYVAQDEVSGTSKLQNLEELINAASLYASHSEGLTSFLEAVELDSTREQNDLDAKVILITMHNTKGLEFDRVIITGLEDSLFPRADDREEVEEERRLFYVAITRARHELHITHCACRRVHGRILNLEPSIFLDEIDSDLVNNYGRRPKNRNAHWQNVFNNDNPWKNWNRHELEGKTASGGEAQGEYAPGQLVFHDAYGIGEVVKSSYNGNEEIIHIHFESGKAGQFIPRYAPIEKISRD